jgi:hypothetical protein
MKTAKKQQISQANLYEFKPSDDISVEDNKELSDVVRVGVTGRVLELLSPNLRKHFMEVKDGQMGKAENTD